MDTAFNCVVVVSAVGVWALRNEKLDSRKRGIRVALVTLSLILVNSKGTYFSRVLLLSLKDVFLNMPDLKTFLDDKVNQFNQPGFIELDPISIPHRFSKQQDIEIMGFFLMVNDKIKGCVFESRY